MFENPEMMECFKNHNKNCTAASSNALNELTAQIQVFKKKLDTFTDLMNEQQKYVVKSSEKVVDVLDENEKYRGSDRYNMPSTGAKDMGVSTISESDTLNNQQDAAYARSLWKELQDTFKGSEKNYADVTEDNYQQKLAPITESFKKVGALKSKVLREQLHGFLKAEELKLATKLYDKQLDGLENQTGQFLAFNETSQDSLTSLAPSAGAAAASTQVAYDPESGLPSVSETSLANPGGLSSSVPASRDPASSAAGEEESMALASIVGAGNAAKIASADDGGEDGEESKISATSASVAPGSLRESLREKIAAKNKAQASATPSDEFGESETGTAKPGADGSVAEGIRGENGYSATDAETQSVDSALAGFSGSLPRDGAFSLSGPGGEDAVTELVGEFRATLREQAAPLAAGVEAMDSESLFERIKEFHVRCLKRGCVAGARKAGKL
jgi:hypothetical protein